MKIIIEFEPTDSSLTIEEIKEALRAELYNPTARNPHYHEYQRIAFQRRLFLSSGKITIETDKLLQECFDCVTLGELKLIAEAKGAFKGSEITKDFVFTANGFLDFVKRKLKAESYLEFVKDVRELAKGRKQ